MREVLQGGNEEAGSTRHRLGMRTPGPSPMAPTTLPKIESPRGRELFLGGDERAYPTAPWALRKQTGGACTSYGRVRLRIDSEPLDLPLGFTLR